MRLGVFGAALILCAPAAFGEEMILDSEIVAATVYPQGASLTRVAAFEAPEGAHVLRMVDFPAGFDADSLRVSGAGDFEIVSVSSAVEPLSEQEVSDQVLEELDAIDQEVLRLNADLAAINAGRRAAERILDNLGPQGDDGALPSADAIRDISALMARATVEEADLRRERDRLQAARAQIVRENPGAQSGVNRQVAMVEIVSPGQIKGELTLTYQLPSHVAGWEPLYDARLDESGETPALTLTRRAAVRQTTGQDWVGVALTLSTARPSGRIAPPDLTARIARLRPVAPQRGVIGGMLSSGYAAPMQQARAAPMEAPAPLALMDMEVAPARERMAELSIEGGAVTFEAPGATDVPSGSRARQIKLSEADFEVELQIRAYPELDEKAYYFTAFDAPEGAPILPGKVSLHRGPRYVGAWRMAFAAAGEDMLLPFGPEDGVTVGHKVLERKDGDEGVVRRTNIRDERYEIEVRNLTGAEQSVRVYARLPVSENDDIDLEIKTEPEAEEAAKRDPRGAMVWPLTLAEGETQTLTYGWTVRWPEDQILDMLNVDE